MIRGTGSDDDSLLSISGFMIHGPWSWFMVIGNRELVLNLEPWFLEFWYATMILWLITLGSLSLGLLG